ncbi:MAG: hypothetical protein WKF68_09025 [Daejeonella sp.]
MKIHLKSALFILMLAFISCDKDKRFENNLDGKWELRHVKGGQRLNVSPDYPPGNGSILKFEGNTFQTINNGSVVSSGTFVIIEDGSDIDGIKFPYKLDFDVKTQLDVYAKASAKKLIIANGSMAVDGSTETYEKL